MKSHRLHRSWTSLGSRIVKRRRKGAGGCWVEMLEDRRLLSAVLSVTSRADTTRLAGNESEASLAINPTNPSNMVSVSATDANGGNAIIVSRSTNGGVSWSTTQITSAQDGAVTNTPRVDPRATFDSYGNLYVSYMVAASSSDVRVMVARSTNGGATFSSATAAVTGSGHSPDFPSIAAGPDGLGHQAVWISYTDYGAGAIEVTHATATGLGQFSSFSTPTVVSSQFGSLSSIAVGPSGQVAVTWQDTDSGSGPSNIYVAADATPWSTAFGHDVWVGQVNVGGWEPIPAQPNRSIFASAQVAFDNSNDSTRGRLYLSYVDAPSAGNAATTIQLRYSDNLGGSWSSALKVNDDSSGKSHFLPALAVDPVSGAVGVSWYDSRNSAGNNTAQVYAAVSTDHGASFSTNVQLSSGVSNANSAVYASGPTGILDYGDYIGLALYNNVLAGSWADNSNSLGGNPNGTLVDFDNYAGIASIGQGSVTPPTPSNGGSPFGGSALNIASSGITTLEAENFNNGGQGVAYNWYDASNVFGSNYRAGTGVGVYDTSQASNGHLIGWVKAGEWLDYTVNVSIAGTYQLGVRTASVGAGGTFHVSVDGVNVTGTLAAPNTGGWTNWQTVNGGSISLSAGQHVIQLAFDSSQQSNGYMANFDDVTFTGASSPAPVGSGTPFGGSALNVASSGATTIEAENFNNGGQGVAYNWYDASNVFGSTYRAGTGVGVYDTSQASNGHLIGWVKAGEWLNYTVNVSTAGTYQLGIRTASVGAGGTFHVSVDGVNVTGTLAAPNTGGWTNWQTVNGGAISLSAGQHVIQLAFDASQQSNGYMANFDSLTLTA